jgi:hypothetical protein
MAEDGVLHLSGLYTYVAVWDAALYMRSLPRLLDST